MLMLTMTPTANGGVRSSRRGCLGRIGMRFERCRRGINRGVLVDILIAIVIVVIAAVLGIVVHPVLWVIIIAAVLWLFVRRGRW